MQSGTLPRMFYSPDVFWSISSLLCDHCDAGDITHGESMIMVLLLEWNLSVGLPYLVIASCYIISTLVEYILMYSPFLFVSLTRSTLDRLSYEDGSHRLFVIKNKLEEFSKYILKGHLIKFLVVWVWSLWLGIDYRELQICKMRHKTRIHGIKCISSRAQQLIYTKE
ncbi:hypothetical protein ACJX0J_013339 [Zea mays]